MVTRGEKGTRGVEIVVSCIVPTVILQSIARSYLLGAESNPGEYIKLTLYTETCIVVKLNGEREIIDTNVNNGHYVSTEFE